MTSVNLAAQVTACVVGGYILLLALGVLIGRACSLGSAPGDADGRDDEATRFYRDKDGLIVELCTRSPETSHAVRRRHDGDCRPRHTHTGV